MSEVNPLNMHTDAQAQPAGSVTPCNMHTDMVIGSGTNGTLHLSAKNATGAPTAVTITSGMAGKLGRVLGLDGPPAADPHAPAPVSPFNMHTDSQTRVSANPDGTRATLEGPADGPAGAVALRVTISGPALVTVKGSHAGI